MFLERPKLIEEFIVLYGGYLWGILIGTGVIFGFREFRKWNIEKFKERKKAETQKIKLQPEVVSQDIQKYVNSPELTIKALLLDRQICEKAKDTKGIEIIDKEIQALQFLVRVPAPMRPFLAKIGQVGMKKIENIVEGI